MNVAVIGSSGQLGRDVVTAAREAGLSVAALSHDQVEVADFLSVSAALVASRADAVVNCAAYVRVDEAEDRPEDALRVNALGALHVARAAQAIGAVCVYPSSDYVFDGAKPQPYVEDDVPRPINVYGTSKLAGELLTRQGCPGSLVVRLASLFGTGGTRGKGGNFVETILGKAASGEPLRVADDLYMSPTYSRDAARALACLLCDRVTGTVHIANRGATTWYQLATYVLQLAGVAGKIEPIAAQSLHGRAPRPRNSALSTSRTGRFTTVLRPWQDAVREYVAQTV